MSEDVTYMLSGAMPWQERVDVNIHTNEYVQQSTINRGFNRLLENDIVLFNNLLAWAEVGVKASSSKIYCDVLCGDITTSGSVLNIVKNGENFYLPLFRNDNKQ